MKKAIITAALLLLTTVAPQAICTMSCDTCGGSGVCQLCESSGKDSSGGVCYICSGTKHCYVCEGNGSF